MDLHVAGAIAETFALIESIKLRAMPIRTSSASRKSNRSAKFNSQDYKLGWICTGRSGGVGRDAALRMLDFRHELETVVKFPNKEEYFFGSISGQNVVIIHKAPTLLLDRAEILDTLQCKILLDTDFPNLVAIFSLGVASGIPKEIEPGIDVRLGDVVISQKVGSPPTVWTGSGSVSSSMTLQPRMERVLGEIFDCLELHRSQSSPSWALLDEISRHSYLRYGEPDSYYKIFSGPGIVSEVRRLALVDTDTLDDEEDRVHAQVTDTRRRKASHSDIRHEQQTPLNAMRSKDVNSRQAWRDVWEPQEVHPYYGNPWKSRCSEPDVLYNSEYEHTALDPSCSSCDRAQAILRPPRMTGETVEKKDHEYLSNAELSQRISNRFVHSNFIHLGAVASSLEPILNPDHRDQISKNVPEALCIENDAIGFGVFDRRCVIVRGIANYGDSHGNSSWRHYAARMAASTVKLLITELGTRNISLVTNTLDLARLRKKVARREHQIGDSDHDPFDLWLAVGDLELNKDSGIEENNTKNREPMIQNYFSGKSGKNESTSKKYDDGMNQTGDLEFDSFIKREKIIAELISKRELILKGEMQKINSTTSSGIGNQFGLPVLDALDFMINREIEMQRANYSTISGARIQSGLPNRDAINFNPSGLQTSDLEDSDPEYVYEGSAISFSDTDEIEAELAELEPHAIDRPFIKLADSDHLEVSPESWSIGGAEEEDQESLFYGRWLRSRADHVLPDYKGDFSSEQVEIIMQCISEQMRENFKLETVYGMGECWTFEHTGVEELDSQVPLTLAGRPVIIPLSFSYPPTASYLPPKDPRLEAIDPRYPLSEDEVSEIFSQFKDCTGFYILLNGRLQIIVSDDFDYEYASINDPILYGGLKINYVRDTILATANTTTGISSSQTSIFDNNTADITPQTSSKTATSDLTIKASQPSPIELSVPVVGNTVFFGTEGGRLDAQARVKGKIGLLLSSRDDIFATAPSHVIYKMLALTRNQSLLSDNWTNGVSAYIESGKKQIGAVVRTFDPKARQFPRGYKHDISLIKLECSASDAKDTNPFPYKVQWAEDFIDFQNAKLCFLHDPDLIGKGFESRDTQIVGQAIFKTMYSKKSASLNPPSKRSWVKSLFSRKPLREPAIEAKDWENTVAYSSALLYRLKTDIDRADSFMSGTAVCLDNRDELGSVSVAGFNAFAQIASHDPYSEGQVLASKLAKGSVAFLGAFRVPAELRNKYEIVYSRSDKNKAPVI